MSITLHQARAFKKAVDILLKHEGTRLPYYYGLCNNLDSIIWYTMKSPSPVYSIMGRLLSVRQYSNGLGPDGVFNKARRNFLLLLQVMQPKDIQAICKD